LWDVGYRTAETFYTDSAGAVRGPFVPAERYRYLNTFPVPSRVDDFLRLFGPGVNAPLNSTVPFPPGTSSAGP
jgi:hypothetical protein